MNKLPIYDIIPIGPKKARYKVSYIILLVLTAYYLQLYLLSAQLHNSHTQIIAYYYHILLRPFLSQNLLSHQHDCTRMLQEISLISIILLLALPSSCSSLRRRRKRHALILSCRRGTTASIQHDFLWC